MPGLDEPLLDVNPLHEGPFHRGPTPGDAPNDASKLPLNGIPIRVWDELWVTAS